MTFATLLALQRERIRTDPALHREIAAHRWKHAPKRLPKEEWQLQSVYHHPFYDTIKAGYSANRICYD